MLDNLCLFSNEIVARKQAVFEMYFLLLDTLGLFLDKKLIKVICLVAGAQVDKFIIYMWDLKLQVMELSFYIAMFLHSFSLNFLSFLDPYFYNGLALFNWKIFFQFAQNTTFFFALKFLFSIGFLILIRGGTPRYRYDYLTKLGWLKFLTLVVVIFFISLLNFFIF